MKKRIIRKSLALILIAVVFATGAVAVTTDFGSAATSSTSKKITKKVTNKVVKTKKASKKTYKKVQKINKIYGTKTVKNTSTQKVTQKKTVKKVIVTKATKKSRKKAIKTTKTTTTLTTTTKKVYTSIDSATAASLKASVTPALAAAFDKLGFEIKLNTGAGYAGMFSTTKHRIELQSVNKGVFRHEMGHFLDALKNKASRTSQFQAIYAAEKNAYSGTNKSYVTGTAQEYFAESYRNYLENGAKLKAERPRTYAYIKSMAVSISDTDISRTYNQYSWSW